MKFKIKKIVKFAIVSLLFIGIATYIIIAMTSMTSSDPEELCSELSLKIKENPKANFIDVPSIERSLKAAKLYPKGKRMDEINTKEIERHLMGNHFIESVECYKSSTGCFCIDITQRTPSLYILPNNGNGYFVDRQGKIIPNTNYSANIVTATGDIDHTYATNTLLPFGNYIQDNAFWDSQIEQIHVIRDKNNRLIVQLVPRVGEHIVNMGTIDNFEKKLKRLKTFYKKAISTVGWNKYETIDIQYDNQIICTKQKK